MVGFIPSEARDLKKSNIFFGVLSILSILTAFNDTAQRFNIFFVIFTVTVDGIPPRLRENAPLLIIDNGTAINAEKIGDFLNGIFFHTRNHHKCIICHLLRHLRFLYGFDDL